MFRNKVNKAQISYVIVSSNCIFLFVGVKLKKSNAKEIED